MQYLLLKNGDSMVWFCIIQPTNTELFKQVPIEYWYEIDSKAKVTGILLIIQLTLINKQNVAFS